MFARTSPSGVPVLFDPTYFLQHQWTARDRLISSEIAKQQFSSSFFYDVTLLGSRGNPDPDLEERDRRSSSEKEGGTPSLD